MADDPPRWRRRNRERGDMRVGGGGGEGGKKGGLIS